MGKKKTPIIQKLRLNGGTLYVFPSSSEDIGLNLLSSTTGVAMSHYALLDIPLLTISQIVGSQDSTEQDPNVALAASLQNYMMNMETTLTNQENYNYQALNTVTEKTFWHWAKHVGIIKAKTTSQDGLYTPLDRNGNPIADNVYAESGHDANASKMDNTVIKCFGSIDAGNSLSTEFGMYNETYITIPTSFGAGPVYFRSSSDSNFKLGTSYKHTSGNINTLEGRGQEVESISYLNGHNQPYFDKPQEGTYDIEPTMDALEIVKDIPTILSLLRKEYHDDTITIGSYDDINIDIDNKFSVDEKFEFNAILLYYSVYDQDDIVKTSYATNLFGIIFLEGCKKTEGNSFYIPTLTKRKSTTESFGSSFSFRVNLKTMSIYDNTDAVIQDNTTMSSVQATEFSDVISNLNKAIDIMNTNVQVTSEIQNKYASLMAYYDSFETTIEDLSTNLYAYLKGNHTSIVDTNLVKANIYVPNDDNEENNIVFGVRSSNEYTPVLTINGNGLSTTTMQLDNLISKNSFIYVETTKYDKHVTKGNSDESDVLSAKNILKKMFNHSDKLIIKTKHDEDYAIDGQWHYRLGTQLYIDPESPIFENIGVENLSALKNGEAIDYVKLIPYILARLQELS